MASKGSVESAVRRAGASRLGDAHAEVWREGAGVDVVRLALVGIFSVLPFCGSDPRWLVAAVAVTMVVVVIKWRGESGLRDFAVFVLVAVVARFPYLGLPWPVPLVLPILVYGGMRKWRGASRVVASVDCARDAATLSTTLRYALIGSACAAVGLLGWYQLAAPDLTTFARLIPAWPLPAIILAGVVFYCLNAITEELAFRNIVYGQLTVAGLSIAYVIAAQALAFGFLHWHGVPGGVPGIVLSAIYGLVQGVIRHKSRGLLAPWLSHVVADLIIFAFVLRSVA